MSNTLFKIAVPQHSHTRQ